jgi:small subunit ribosomal protein S7
MSRRRRAVKRQIEKDPRYGNMLISQLVNMIMQRGKKNLARSIVYNAIERVSEKIGKGDRIDLLLGHLKVHSQKSKLKAVALVVRPIKFRSRFPMKVSMRWCFAG